LKVAAGKTARIKRFWWEGNGHSARMLYLGVGNWKLTTSITLCDLEGRQ
jgi:hypothetical protein